MTPEVLGSLSEPDQSFWERLDQQVKSDLDAACELGQGRDHETRKAIHGELIKRIMAGATPRLNPTAELREVYASAINDHNGWTWCNVRQLRLIFDFEGLPVAS